MKIKYPIIKTFLFILGFFILSNSTAFASESDILDAYNQAEKKTSNDRVGRDEYIRNGAPINRYYFDYDWYLKKHPDVAAAIGTNRDDIWNFYVTVGEPAGWYGRCSRDTWTSVLVFDADVFLANNPDVLSAFSTLEYYNDNVIYYYWFEVGKYEGRQAPITSTKYTSNYERYLAAMNAYDIVDSIITDDMSDREKAKAIHDWLCKNVAYDHDNYVNNTVPDSSYTIEGPFLYNTSVCKGYAEAFTLMANVAGMQCKTINGTAYNGRITDFHAWNKILIDNEWYYVDVTWDDPTPDSGKGVVYRYKYFLISKDEMGKDHFE